MNPTLRLGDKGDAVKRLQALIGAEPDGEFGPMTAAGLREAQRARGLAADGVAGPKTWAALQKSQNAPHAAPGGRVVIPEHVIREGFPRCAQPAEWAAACTAAAAAFPMFNLLGWATFLGKAKIETGDLRSWDEGMNYSTAAQILSMHGARAVRTAAAKDELRRRAKNDPWPPLAIAEASELIGKPVEMGNRVYAHLGGYAARGGGMTQLTGLENQTAFARDMGMTLDEARTYIRTIPGAAMTSPWYQKYMGPAGITAANRGDMREVMRMVAGKRNQDEMDVIWARIHGDTQMAAFEKFARLLGA